MQKFAIERFSLIIRDSTHYFQQLLSAQFLHLKLHCIGFRLWESLFDPPRTSNGLAVMFPTLNGTVVPDSFILEAHHLRAFRQFVAY